MILGDGITVGWVDFGVGGLFGMQKSEAKAVLCSASHVLRDFGDTWRR